MAEPEQLLSGRQLEAARLAAAGLGEMAIAKRMRIRPGTARRYLRLARHRTGTRNRHQLGRWIREHGLQHAGRGNAATAAREES